MVVDLAADLTALRAKKNRGEATKTREPPQHAKTARLPPTLNRGDEVVRDVHGHQPLPGTYLEYRMLDITNKFGTELEQKTNQGTDASIAIIRF